MSRLAPLLRVARASGALAWTAAAFAALEAKILARRDDLDASAERELQRWCRGLLRLGGVELRIEGAWAPARGGRLVLANHRSAYDIVILYALFGGSMLSRAEVAGWPIFGQAARRSGTIFPAGSTSTSSRSASRTRPAPNTSRIRSPSTSPTSRAVVGSPSAWPSARPDGLTGGRSGSCGSARPT